MLYALDCNLALKNHLRWLSMLYGLIGLCLLLIGYGFWLIYRKITIVEHYVQQKRIKKVRPNALSKVQPSKTPVAGRLYLVEEYEQQLFDDAATLFIQQPRLDVLQFEQAAVLQDRLLQKMPAQTQAQIRRMDLAEWSIYCHFFEQSLECYVGRYGVFYTHVDRHGIEHRQVQAFRAEES